MLVNGYRIRTSRIGLIAIGVIIFYYVFFRGPAEVVDPFVTYSQEQISNVKGKVKTSEDAIEAAFLKVMDREVGECPDYIEHSQKAHLPFSSGKYSYPFMRPAPKCRTFKSEAVEVLIRDLKKKIKDPDLARLVENCLPNTLDTTILWHTTTPNLQSFVVTGDIHAEWLRDAARQLLVYQPLIKYDPGLKDLILGAINTQAKYLTVSPYCNAFHPPPESGVKRGNTAIDLVFPTPDWKFVFECKYEIDSLASFLTLSNEYYENSDGDTSFINTIWLHAFRKLLIVLTREQQPSFDAESGQARRFYYSFQRDTRIGSETLPLGGVGNPVNFGTGLIRSAFRPSDDATILQFFVPGNMHLVTELRKMRSTYFQNEELYDIELIETADKFIADITHGIETYGIIDHPIYGRVYAYEVDGYGGSVFMDDANIPSLLSIPDLGYALESDPVYQATRKMILEKLGNPYYLQGKYFEGVGGPHIGIESAWPMSLLMRIRTTDDETEILRSLKLVMGTTAGLGLMHESVRVNSPGGKDYTRSWFAWCNSEFGKTILYLAKNKPHLIFKKEYVEEYDLDALFLG